MSNKDFKKLRELAESLKNEITAENAMHSFISAGILKKDGELTDEYENLEEILHEQESDNVLEKK